MPRRDSRATRRPDRSVGPRGLDEGQLSSRHYGPLRGRRARRPRPKNGSIPAVPGDHPRTLATGPQIALVAHPLPRVSARTLYRPQSAQAPSKAVDRRGVQPDSPTSSPTARPVGATTTTAQPASSQTWRNTRRVGLIAARERLDHVDAVPRPRDCAPRGGLVSPSGRSRPPTPAQASCRQPPHTPARTADGAGQQLATNSAPV